MDKRLLLDGRLIAQQEGCVRALGPCTLNPEPCTLDGLAVWKKNNLHFAWHRDPETGQLVGWHNTWVPDAETLRGRPHVFRVRSTDGLHWETAGGPSIAESVVCDDADPDGARRYKCVYQGAAVLDERGEVAIPYDQPERLRAAAAEGRSVRIGMFCACSPDGLAWHTNRPIVLNTFRGWQTEKGDAGQRWWRPGEPGWAGGDSFPCLLHLPEQGTWVAFFRTNVDRRTPGDARPLRRERAVGRSETADFAHWSPHRLALRADVDWQRALGRGKHDLYQMQVWPAAGLFLGILSVFDWEDDRNHLELAWSPDTLHWERICPGSDLVPHGRLGEPGGGCSYAAMRPQRMGDELWVYFGADTGRHNADPEREATLLLARFAPDRLAGMAPAGRGRGTLVTCPLLLDGAALHLNANAVEGSIQVELRTEAGQPLPDYTFADSIPLAGDLADHTVAWHGRPALPAHPVRIALSFTAATVYSLWAQ